MKALVLFLFYFIASQIQRKRAVGKKPEWTHSVCRWFYWKKPVGVFAMHACTSSLQQVKNIWSKWKPHNQTQGLPFHAVPWLQPHGRILQGTFFSYHRPPTGELFESSPNDPSGRRVALVFQTVDRSGCFSFQCRPLVERRQNDQDVKLFILLSHIYCDEKGKLFPFQSKCFVFPNPVFRGCYFQEGGRVNMTMDIMEAFRRSLQTWKSWAFQNLDPQRSHIFFRSYSPVHYRQVFLIYISAQFHLGFFYKLDYELWLV